MRKERKEEEWQVREIERGRYFQRAYMEECPRCLRDELNLYLEENVFCSHCVEETINSTERYFLDPENEESISIAFRLNRLIRDIEEVLAGANCIPKETALLWVYRMQRAILKNGRAL